MNGVLPRPLAVALVRRDRPGPVPLRAGHGDLGLADGVRLRPRRRAAVLDMRCAGSAPDGARRRSRSGWSPSLRSCSRIHTPVYATITAVCTIFLYVSYVLPTALGAWAYGRTWTAMGPWDLGRWYRPLAVLSVAGCAALIVIGMQPPNERSVWVVGGTALVLAAAWFGVARHRFPGPPQAALDELRKRSRESPFRKLASTASA